MALILGTGPTQTFTPFSPRQSAQTDLAPPTPTTRPRTTNVAVSGGTGAGEKGRVAAIDSRRVSDAYATADANARFDAFREAASDSSGPCWPCLLVALALVLGGVWAMTR